MASKIDWNDVEILKKVCFIPSHRIVARLGITGRWDMTKLTISAQMILAMDASASQNYREVGNALGCTSNAVVKYVKRLKDAEQKVLNGGAGANGPNVSSGQTPRKRARKSPKEEIPAANGAEELDRIPVLKKVKKSEATTEAFDIKDED